MSKCKFEELIDDYLLGRLADTPKEEFEKHYFDCASCFTKMVERDELISVVKHRADVIFQDLITDQASEKMPLFERAFAFFTPKVWASAVISAALVLVVVLAILPSLRSTAPQFSLSDDMVRGKSITLISDGIPTQFRWESLGEGVEYKIYIDNHKLLWSETTPNNFISLPEDVKAKMRPGIKYFWQVKAFSSEGTLIAESSKVQFLVGETK